jgi:hypothetical protein
MALMPAQDHDLPYRVELWDDRDTHVEEVGALWHFGWGIARS